MYTAASQKKTIMNRSAPASTVIPVLVYENVSEAIEWLCEIFGFKERLRAAGPGGRVTHAQLSLGDRDIMIGAAGAGFCAPHPNEVNQYFIVRVEDVDLHFAQAKRFGARIVQAPANMPFGERVYTVEDLAGHHWTFSQSIADVALDKWGERQPSKSSKS